jgi:hypothetical protein
MAQSPAQVKRCTRILAFKGSHDRRKMRRWINQVVRMTRCEVQEKGISISTSPSLHRRQMYKLRHKRTVKI